MKTFKNAWRAPGTSPSWRSSAATASCALCGSIRTLKSKFMGKEWKIMHPAFTVSRTSIRLRGVAIPGAEDRQRRISGFDQEIFSCSRVLCVGAGGLISFIAPPLVRKGVGGITLVDDDFVETSNLNRQRFYTKDVGRNKALALAENLLPECIAETEIRGIPFRLQEAIARELDLSCDVAICGVDNNVSFRQVCVNQRQ
jgi:hypothetical protein